MRTQTPTRDGSVLPRSSAVSCPRSAPATSSASTGTTSPVGWGGTHERRDLLRHGYSRALWIAAPGVWWMRPGSLSVCTEEEAIAAVNELIRGNDDEEESAE
jgi:hypothetical protein